MDESGHAADPQQRYFVLAGVSIYERQTWWMSNQLDEIAARFNPGDPESVELHGSPMLQGRGEWKLHTREKREQAMRDALAVLVNSYRTTTAFAVVVEKAAVSPNAPVSLAFEQLVTRFDLSLSRMHRADNTQKGLILFDKSVHEASLQKMTHDFRTAGHSWGVLRNLSEVPVFIDSRASRLIQLADLVAYSMFRKWEKTDSRFYDVIRERFDREGGVTHGLHVMC